LIPKGGESSKSHEQVNKGGCIKTKKNQLSTQFDRLATFPSWLGFLSCFSTCLEAYPVAECVSHAWKGGQPIKSIA